jgi:hypothetical protein
VHQYIHLIKFLRYLEGKKNIWQRKQPTFEPFEPYISIVSYNEKRQEGNEKTVQKPSVPFFLSVPSNIKKKYKPERLQTIRNKRLLAIFEVHKKGG